jgi:hypothetical protein
MSCYQILLVLGGALALLAEQGQRPDPTHRQQPTDSVFVTGAHGDALVPVRIVVPRQAVASTSGKGTWSGDTLSTRTPLVLSVRRPAPTISVQAIGGRAGVRVTLPPRASRTIATRTGPSVQLRTGAGGLSLSGEG